MTLAKGLRQASLIFLMLALAVAFGLMGNQRHAQAAVPVSGSDINCEIDENTSSPIPDFCDDGSQDDDNDPQGPIDPPIGGDDINCAIDEAYGDPIPEFCDEDNGGGPVDVCPNDEGVQTETPCPSEDVCPNDEGIQIETPCPSDNQGGGNGGDTSSSGGGGGGGGGGSKKKTSGEVLGVATDTTISCDLYLTEFIRFGGNNNPEQVTRLQSFLNTYEGTNLQESGVYDEATLAAVHAFQQKYAAQILHPWGATRSTGFVYLTTRKMVNEIRCERLFPLSAAEQAEVDAYRAGTPVAPAAAPAFEAGGIELPTTDLPAAAAAAPEASAPQEPEPPAARRGFLSSILNWLFGR